MSDKRVTLYDSTLRDGAQTQGIDFSPADKELIAHELDAIGIDYIEGGWPGANATDDAFFANPPELKRARLTAFGMTRRAGRSADNDPSLTAVLSSPAKTICIFGKTWDFQAEIALGVDLEENIKMIADTIEHACTKSDDVMFDAEHFFDGYKANKDYAVNCLKAAYDAGAHWVVLCDTNGGTLPDEIERIVTEITQHIPGSNLGIHCHDDTGNAVANSLAAVRAGARQIQGTLNGLGERCGNANLVTLIPTLQLKMGYETGLTDDDLTRLTHLSRMLDERLNRQPNRSAPYVGESAFAHKGGVHASAVEKNPATYEHIEPEKIGNRRHIVVSDQSGRSNILARFREAGIDIDPKDKRVAKLVETVKEQEFNGYAYDGAEASFELLARRALGAVPDYFHCTSFKVLDERRWNENGDLVTSSEATVKLDVQGESHMAVAEGNGPVNALDAAIRKVLSGIYPQLEDLRLVDYKVRILTPGAGTRAVTRVMIESADKNGEHWSTVGVSANIIDASYNALRDSIIYKLHRDGAVDSHS
ncbi:MAG: (R)-citramalate synthase [Alphaproteobacteria bacterium MarineAlpha3_Bin2]|jgi:2-isopropylmalate synthase|nr:MAG: (R)-citramalate synthase [Alphaproteobacteria bacterium MarineAlpha3_Bin2]